MRRLLSVVTMLALASCGFQLRDRAELPASLARLRIEVSDPFSRAGVDLGRALTRSGAEIVAEDGSVPVLRILEDTAVTTPLTVSGNARVQEYQVVARLRFELLDATGKPMLAAQTIERRRDYRFDETQALGASAEDDMARRELHRELIAALLRQLEAQ